MRRYEVRATKKDKNLEREHCPQKKEKGESKIHPDAPRHKNSKSERPLEEERERIRKASVEAELASVFERVAEGVYNDRKTEANCIRH